MGFHILPRRAVPRVKSSASSGLIDGGTATIIGSGFGTVSSPVQLWDGGKNGIIETTANDTDYNTVSAASFKKLASIPASTNVWRINTGRTYGNRTRSLLWDTTDARNDTVSNIGQACMVWSPGLSSLGKKFSTYKMYIELPTLVASYDVQIKTERLISQYTAESASGVSDADGNNILMSNRWQGGQTGHFEGYFGPNGGMTFPPFSGASFFGDSGWTPADVGLATCIESGWYELEVEFTDSTTLSSTDGYLSHTLKRLSDGVVVGSHIRNNIALYAGAGTRYKYINMQLGCFNGAGAGINEGGNVKIWMLDHYHVANSRAHVRLSDNATYANAVISEPCPFSSWSDTSISVSDVNRGAHANLTGKFWHVWNDAGTLTNPTTGIVAT